MNAVLEAGQAFAWPSDEAILLIVTDGAGYNRALRDTAGALARHYDAGVFLTANRPHHALRDLLGQEGIDASKFTFIDCVSSMTGIAPPAEPGVLHIESPTMMEKMAMRADQVLRRSAGRRRFVLLDSLSTLSVYNGANTVAEMAHNLITRLRMQSVGAALILVEKQAGEELLDTVKPLCDNVVRLPRGAEG